MYTYLHVAGHGDGELVVLGATPKTAAMSRGLTPAEQNELVALGRGKELTADAAARIRVLNERVLCQRYANAG